MHWHAHSSSLIPKVELQSNTITAPAVIHKCGLLGKCHFSGLEFSEKMTQAHGSLCKPLCDYVLMGFIGEAACILNVLLIHNYTQCFICFVLLVPLVVGTAANALLALFYCSHVMIYITLPNSVFPLLLLFSCTDLMRSFLHKLHLYTTAITNICV